MPKKRGLSLEEKRERILEIFHKNADVYQFKEVEKLALNSGVALLSIKDVLQSLVDDNLVHEEKIGQSKYFWSFPAESSTKLENELNKLEQELIEAQSKREKLEILNRENEIDEEELSKKITLMDELDCLNRKNNKLELKLHRSMENDPEVIKSIKEAIEASREAANRWLDNIYTLRDWCKKTFPGRDSETNKFFQEQGLTDDADYI